MTNCNVAETDRSAFNIYVISDTLNLRIKFENIIQEACFVIFCVILVRIQQKKLIKNV